MRFFKSVFKISMVAAVLFGLFAWYLYEQAHQPLSQPDDELVVNDITGLNPISVNRIVKPTTEQHITDAILDSSGPISIGGARYSMGGQIAFPDSLHFDMRDFNQVVELNTENKTISVQTGITWREIQQLIDPHELSLMVMQDFNNFTVGGALSVNAHGRFMGTGPLINSVREIRIALADGQIYTANREYNSALFYGAIGGYGGLGVITQATLQLVDNIALERQVSVLDFYEFLPHFKNNILKDEQVVLHNAFLYPPGFESVLDISWRKTDQPLTDHSRLREYDENNWWRPVLIDMMARSDYLKRLRKGLIDPLIYQQPAVVLRNYETSYDLRNYGFVKSDHATLAMREYFVPLDKFEVFVLKLRDTFTRYDVDVLNVTVRYTPKDVNSILSWSQDDVFSFMVLYRQGKDEVSIAEVDAWSKELIRGSIDSNGTYYLPFQNQASSEQFLRAYPGVVPFLQLKKKADPEHRFNNMLWAQHENLLQLSEQRKLAIMEPLHPANRFD